MSAKNKATSLRWAIDELSKQKEDLASKLKVARKREETNSLIEEVFAQKDALEKRISALQDGLRVSTDLVDSPLPELESELNKVNEKLGIAQERLENIEQEEYLQELGKKLNRSHSMDSESIIDEPHAEPDIGFDTSMQASGSEAFTAPPPSPSSQLISPSSDIISPSSSSPLLQETMKAKTNRIPEIVSENQPEFNEKSSTAQPVSSASTISLEETASNLGVDPGFLSEKGLQAILRMIARNDGKLTFPLEVQQID